MRLTDSQPDRTGLKLIVGNLRHRLAYLKARYGPGPLKVAKRQEGLSDSEKEALR